MITPAILICLPFWDQIFIISPFSLKLSTLCFRFHFSFRFIFKLSFFIVSRPKKLSLICKPNC